MSARTCPDWPDLMELAPDLQFMHYTVAEAQLLHQGRLTMVWEVKIFEEGTRRLLAAASMSFVLLAPRK